MGAATREKTLHKDAITLKSLRKNYGDVALWVSVLLVLVLTLFFFALCVQLFKKGYKLRA